MIKFQVDYIRNNYEDFSIVWAKTPAEAKAWAEQNLCCTVTQVSLRDYNEERNGKDLVLWKRG